MLLIKITFWVGVVLFVSGVGLILYGLWCGYRAEIVLLKTLQDKKDER